MKDGLEDILSYVHRDLGIRTTLSTNGILLKRKAKQILPYVDDIGIPLDGHTMEVNNISARFKEVVEKVRDLNPEFPKISVLPTDKHVGRYFHIYPDGKTHVFFDRKRWLSYSIPDREYRKKF